MVRRNTPYPFKKQPPKAIALAVSQTQPKLTPLILSAAGMAFSVLGMNWLILTYCHP